MLDASFGDPPNANAAAVKVAAVAATTVVQIRLLIVPPFLWRKTALSSADGRMAR
jgi:hypothetical protein